MSEAEVVVGGGDSGAAGIETPSLEQKKRGRKPGSKVKMKGGAIRVNGPRKPKVSHGWCLQAGLTKAGRTRWSVGEQALQVKSVKTAVREAKDRIVKTIESTKPEADETLSVRIFEVKYLNLDVKLVPQAPKLVL